MDNKLKILLSDYDDAFTTITRLKAKESLSMFEKVGLRKAQSNRRKSWKELTSYLFNDLEDSKLTKMFLDYRLVQLPSEDYKPWQNIKWVMKSCDIDSHIYLSIKQYIYDSAYDYSGERDLDDTAIMFLDLLREEFGSYTFYEKS